MSFGGGVDLGSASGRIEIGSDLQGIERAQKSLATFQKQATTAGKQISEQFKKIGDAAKQAGQVLSLAVTAPLVLAGKNAVGAASDLNEAMSATETVFGGAAESVKVFAEAANRDLGISEEAALSAAVQYAGLAKQAGLTGEASADFSKQLLQNSADLASFYNASPDEVLTALRAGLIGETEPLRRFNILISDATVKQEALRLGLAASEDQITDSMKVAARYSLIQQQMGDAAGDFARTSGGLANSQRILSATLTDLSATLGQVMLPTVLRGVQTVQAFAERIEAAGPRVQSLIVKFGLVAAAAGPVLIVVGQLVSALATVGPVVAALLGPLGLVAAGIAALAVAWKNNWGGIQDIVSDVVGRVTDFLSGLVDTFTAAKERGLDVFDAAFVALIKNLKTTLGEAAPITDFVIELYRVLNDLGDAMKGGDWEGFFAVLDRASTRLTRWFEEQIEAAKTFVRDFARSFIAQNTDGDTQSFLLGLMGINTGDMRASAAGMFREVLAAVQGAVTQFRDDVARLLIDRGVGRSNAGNVVLGLLGVDAGSLEDNVRGVFEDLTTAWTTHVAPFLETVKAIGQGILDEMLASIRAIKFDEVGSAIQQGLAALSRGGSWLLNAIMGIGASGGGGTASSAANLGRQIVGYVVDRVQEADWEEIGTALVDGIGRATVLFLDFTKWRLERLSELGAAIIGYIREVNWDEVGTAIQQGMLAALEVLSNLWTWIQEKLLTVEWESINQTLWEKSHDFVENGLVPGFLAALEAQWNLTTWVAEKVNEFVVGPIVAGLRTRGQELVSGLMAGIQDKSDDLAALFNEMGGRIAGWFEEKVKAAAVLVEQGKALLGGILTGAVLKLVEVATWFQKLPAAILNALPDLGETLLQAGKDLIAGLWTGAQQRFEQFKTDFQNMFDGWKPDISLPGIDGNFGGLVGGDDVAQQAHDDMEEVGEQGGDGLALGISNSKAAVDEASRGLVQTMSTAVAQEQESASPSRLMARHGVDAGEGYGQGLDATLGSIAETARSIVGTVADELSKLNAEQPSGINGWGGALQNIVDRGREALGVVHDFAYEVKDIPVDPLDGPVRQATGDVVDAVDDAMEDTTASVAQGLDDQSEEWDQYSEDVAKINHDLAAELKKIDHDLVAARRDASAQMIDIERAYSKQVRDLNQQAADVQQQAQEQLADLAQQRADAQLQAEQEIADAQKSFADSQRQNAQQIADINRAAQQQAQEAARAWQEMSKANLQAQKEVRAELQASLRDAQKTFRETTRGYADDIKDVRADLAKSLSDSQADLKASLEDFARDTLEIAKDLAESLADLEFSVGRDQQDNAIDTARTKEDRDRDLAENARKLAEAQADLQAVLNDPRADANERARAQEQATRREAELAREREEIEFEAARRLQDLELQRQRDAEDAARREEELTQQAAEKQAEIERRRAEEKAAAAAADAAAREEAAARIRELEAQQAAAEKQHQQEIRELKRQAREDERNLEKERDAAEKAYQRDRQQAERETASQIKGIRGGEVQAERDLAAQIKAIRADLAKTVAGYAQDETGIYDEQKNRLAEIERDRRILARDTARDRAVAAREAAHEEELIQRDRLQAERNAERAARNEARNYQKTLQGDEQREAAPHGEKVGRATGTGISSGLRQSEGQVRTASTQLRTAVEQGAGGNTGTMNQAGVNMGTAFIQGIMSKRDAARIAGKLLAQAAQQGVEEAGEINSPSRVFTELGINTGLGYVNGIRNQIPAAARAARDMVAAVASQTDVQTAQRQQAAGWTAVGQQVAAERRRRAQASAFPQMPENIYTTVVLDDGELGRVVIGHAISPLLEAIDRTQGGGAF